MKKNHHRIYLIVFALAVGVGLLFVLRSLGEKNTVMLESMVQNKPYQVQVTVPNQLTSSRPATVRLRVTENEEPVSLLDRDTLIHATVVSSDSSDVAFYNLTDNIEEVRSGVYEFTHQFSAQPYGMWVEINNQTTRNHHGPKQVDYLSYHPLNEALYEPRPTVTTSITSHSGQKYGVTLSGPTPVHANTPTTFTVTLTDSAGQSAPLLVDIDHFYLAASYQPQFYELRHVDHAQSGPDQVTTYPVTFPRPGTYGIWFEIYTDGSPGTNELVIGDTIRVPFVIQVE